MLLCLFLRLEKRIENRQKDPLGELEEVATGFVTSGLVWQVVERDRVGTDSQS